MKNVLFALLIMTFILASCNSSEAVNVKSNRVTQSDSGYLVPEKPNELLDRKFGYKVKVAKTDTAKSEGYYENVFISKNFYDKIPNPKNNLIKIYFLKEIEYGKATKEGVYLDLKFNIGYDYKVENK